MSTEEWERGRFEGEVLSRLDVIDARLEKIEGLEVRLRNVETEMAKIKAIAALLGTLAGLAAGWLMKVLHVS